MRTKLRELVFRLNWKVIFSVFLVSIVLAVSIVITTAVNADGDLDHFAITPITSPQTAGTPITGITLTAQDANNVTVTSFTGTVTYSGTAGITGNSGIFTAGQLTDVSVTPTLVGSGLTFIITGAGKTGTCTFDVDPAFNLTVPIWTTWSPSNGSNLTEGPNTSVATPGAVVAAADGWTLTVSDTKTNTNGYMTQGGADVVGANLVNEIEVGITADPVGSISQYQSDLQKAPGYGDAGTFNIPLYISQMLAPSDRGGSYSITLTYIASPTY